ncbi:MAG TPA: type II secretion system protein [Pirellulales bacterium]|nr:type II secretion system protein [Pirellulales bacterium]
MSRARDIAGRHRMASLSTHRGVTLVELLVVIFIMLLITAVSIPVITPALQNRDVREAARMIDVFFNGAKTRAKLNNRIFGVILEREVNNPNACVTLSYCEQPDPYRGDFASTVSPPGAPPGATGSTIFVLGNGGFGFWPAPQPSPVPSGTALTPVPVFPLGDLGWVAGPAPSGTGFLTNIAPGDVVTIGGTLYRIWAGEPFIDLDQNGVCGLTTAFAPNTPVGVQEPFLDVDGSFSWTPPNPAPGQPGNVPGQPYVDPTSGYFVQPNPLAGSPFPTLTWNTPSTPSAFVTYAPFDPVQATTQIGIAYQNTATALATTGIPPTNIFPSTKSSAVLGMTVTPSFSFSFQRRPIKTADPSIQLPDGSAIDFGANYVDSTFNPSNPLVVPIPGSGLEILAANGNAEGFWSTFRANPALDPNVGGTLVGTLGPDSTSVMITFQPSGTVDRVFSWSEANDANSTLSVVNWSDWQGRIPAGPIYLLVGRHEMINGEPTMVPIIPQGVAPLKPIFNVQDPNALWVVINPQTGSLATAENVGYDLNTPIPQNPDPTSPPAQNMPVYWAANVYYARNLARAMLDMGGR